MNKKLLIKYTQEEFLKHRSEEDRDGMIKYMKGHFDFYGVKAPKRKLIEREIKKLTKELNAAEVFEFVEMCWSLPQRELHYTGVEILVYNKKLWDASYLVRIERLITTNSWWDTVDALAPNVAGFIFQKDHELRMKWVDKWNSSVNMWLNRSAIIHQLKYKQDTNLKVLFALIESHSESKEFFIRKASGWALRQASKFYPNDVRLFIAEHPKLSTLTKRVGSKYI